MYLASQGQRFFLRNLFCGHRGKYYGHFYPVEYSMNVNSKSTNSFNNVNTSNASFTENDHNKPFYFDLSTDRNLRKIDRFNECFKHFYEKHGINNNSQYINRIENIFEQWNNEFSKYKGFRTPKTDIKEDDKGIIISIELPGIGKDGVKIDYVNNVLNIQASNKSSTTSNTSNLNETTIEEVYEFRKSVILPENVNTQSIKAQMNNGVLKVIVPRESYLNSKSINVE